MTKILFATATALGAIAVTWMGAGFIASNTLALTVTTVIGAVYLLGIFELLQFRRATGTLAAALGSPPTGDALGSWIAGLHPSLQNAVRVRIEGERVGLPAPVFSPYLVGLLVMLGLLGTFVGMVETLQGAVMALEGSTELEAIRAGLAAPIGGLGLAFGTSVAGVAASAMLGLNATLCRRERMLATRQLDTQIAGPLRQYSLDYHRRETFKAMQYQAEALPRVAEQLTAMGERLDQMGERLSQTLLDNQQDFHRDTRERYDELAGSVGQSLQDSLASSGKLAGESLRPVLQEAMKSIATQSQDTLQQAVEQFSRNAQASSGELTGRIGELLASNEELVKARQHSETAWLEDHQQRMEQLAGTIRTELSALRDDEQQRQQQAVERIGALEATVSEHLGRLGRELEIPMSRLIETASETPKAAAEVIGRLREEVSNNVERDNQLLQERQAVMEQLDSLAKSLAQTAGGQREAIEQLVASSSDLLEGVSRRIDQHIGGQVDKVSGVAAEFAGSAAEIASLGEAFGLAVSLFSESNEKLVASLANIEQSLDKAGSRSDEQMGYYVAQAREIIDQSMLSQREIIEEIRQLGSSDLFAAEAR